MSSSSSAAPQIIKYKSAQHDVISSCDLRASQTTVSTSCSSSSCSKKDYNDSYLKGSPVCFGTVTIRAYEITIGDHPSCKEGPSLSLGWEYKQLKEIPIDVFETYRSKRRRSKNQMHIALETREALVKLLDIPDEEIAAIQNEKEKILKQRLKTKAQMEKKIKRIKQLNRILESVMGNSYTKQ